MTAGETGARGAWAGRKWDSRPSLSDAELFGFPPLWPPSEDWARGQHPLKGAEPLRTPPSGQDSPRGPPVTPMSQAFQPQTTHHPPGASPHPGPVLCRMTCLLGAGLSPFTPHDSPSSRPSGQTQSLSLHHFHSADSHSLPNCL